MRVVCDTNVVVSGLLWGGPPNRILRWAREGLLEIVACQETTAEVRRVLQYKRFSKRLSDLDISSNKAFSYFMNLVTFVPTPEIIPKVISKDPFDNIFLALAWENRVHMIISGDRHLLDFKEYKDIHIVLPSEASTIIETLLVP